MGPRLRGDDASGELIIWKPPNAFARPIPPSPLREPSRRASRSMHGVRDASRAGTTMIRKLKSGEYRLYSRKKNPRTGKRRNLGTFKSRAAAEKHERAVQFFKRGGG